MGLIHSFILPSLLTEGKNPPFTIFARRIIHYMHNAYVLNDSSDRDHLLSFSTLDDARDLFSLVTISLFLNVLDERTYQLSSETIQEDPTVLRRCHEIFDLNAIPVIERHHLCYTRGLSIDLLIWFFENYSFSSVDLEEDDIDAFSTIFIPFVVHVGRQITKYKRFAEENGNTTSSASKEVNRQVQHALFGLDFMRDAWLEEKASDEEERHLCDANDDGSIDLDSFDLDCDLSDYVVKRREEPGHRRATLHGFLHDGKTIADRRFFYGLTSQFDLDNIGEINICRCLFIR